MSSATSCSSVSGGATRRARSGWDIKKSGVKTPAAHCKTKKVAIDKARKISRKAKTELVIHNMDGKIAQKDSHGRDSRKTKG